jgi:hypothetical protein
VCLNKVLREVERKSLRDRLLLLLNDHVRRPKIPVTTFLKVACGARENPGGSGTFSEATPQTTEQREHYAAKSFSVRTGQHLSLGATVEKRGPSNYIEAHFCHCRANFTVSTRVRE